MERPHIVIDYSVHSTANKVTLERHIKNLGVYFDQNVTIEVMAYGKGIELLLQSSDIHNLSGNTTALLACQNTMERMHITQADLIGSAAIVPSGLGHIVDRQLQGWAYIKA